MAKKKKVQTRFITVGGEKIPVMDATSPLRVIVLPEDIEGAVPRDHENCAIARAACRMYGSIAAWVGHRTLYVDTLNEDGERIALRHTLDHGEPKKVEKFDKTGEMPPHGFLASAPRPTEQLENKRIRSAARRLKLRTAPAKKRKKPARKPDIRQLKGTTGARSGTGKRQFSGSAKMANPLV